MNRHYKCIMFYIWLTEEVAYLFVPYTLYGGKVLFTNCEKKDKTISEKRNKILWKRPGDRFTKVIVIRKSKITLTISLPARTRAFH